MKTARFVPSQIWTIAQADSGNAVFIRPEGMDVVLPVYVSEIDIQTLLVELTHILAPRPMVHELMLASIEALRGKLDRVEIYGMRGGTYLCRVVLVQNGKESRLESRPSDILCLSARIECPINVDNDVLVRNAVPIESVSSNGDAPFTAASGESAQRACSQRACSQRACSQGAPAQNGSPQSAFSQDGLPVSSRESPSFAANLQRELQAALDREDYERAASLRDRLGAIVRLQSGQV